VNITNNRQYFAGSVPIVNRQFQGNAEQLNSSNTLGSAPRVQDLPGVSQEFEAIFLKSLFQEMEKTIPKSDLLSSNWVNGYYQEMLFQNLSEQLSKTGGIGIGQMLSKSLKLKCETANKIR